MDFLNCIHDISLTSCHIIRYHVMWQLLIMITAHYYDIIFCVIYIYWLVVSTHLKNMSQLELLFPIYIYMENKSHVPNHQPVDIIYTFIWSCRTRGIPSVSWIFILDPLTARRLQKLHLLFQRLRTQRALVRDQKIHRAFIDDYVYIIL